VLWKPVLIHDADLEAQRLGERRATDEELEVRGALAARPFDL
jgi:hypothetical protein